MALERIVLGELFVNKMLTEVECVGAAQLEINPLPDQDDYLVKTKVGSNRRLRQIMKKIKASTIKEHLSRIKKSLPVLKLV